MFTAAMNRQLELQPVYIGAPVSAAPGQQVIPCVLLVFFVKKTGIQNRREHGISRALFPC